MNLPGRKCNVKQNGGHKSEMWSNAKPNVLFPDMLLKLCFWWRVCSGGCDAVCGCVIWPKIGHWIQFIEGHHGKNLKTDVDVEISSVYTSLITYLLIYNQATTIRKTIGR